MTVLCCVSFAWSEVVKWGGTLTSPVLCNWRLINQTLCERHTRASVLLPLKNIHSNSLLDQIFVLITVSSFVCFFCLPKLAI